MRLKRAVTRIPPDRNIFRRRENRAPLLPPHQRQPVTNKRKLSKIMANNNLMVGLEIGTSKICVVVGESRPDGTLKILGVGEAPSRGVRKGEIVDFETAMKCVHEAVVDAEQKSDVMIKSVYADSKHHSMREGTAAGGGGRCV